MEREKRAHTDELATLVQQAEAKAPEDLTEEDKMALLGRPKAGDITRAQLRIKESKEFKVSVKICIIAYFYSTRSLRLNVNERLRKETKRLFPDDFHLVVVVNLSNLINQYCDCGYLLDCTILMITQ